METRDFTCNQEGLIAAQEFLESLFQEPKPGIIMDEIVSNIVRCSGASKFEIALGRTDDGVLMKFRDDGKAFDPTTEIEAPDIEAGLSERKIGGLGIFMVKKMSKSVSYAREGDRNVLTVVV